VLRLAFRAWRYVGTLTAQFCFFWRIYYWPERFGYAWSPYGALLLCAWQIPDLAYPFVLRYVRKHGVEGRMKAA
jgi:paspaline synthase